MSPNFYKWLGYTLILVGLILLGSSLASRFARADNVIEKMITANGKCIVGGYEYPSEGKFTCDKYVITIVNTQEKEQRIVLTFLTKGNAFGFAGPAQTKADNDGNAYVEIDHVYLPRGSDKPEWGVNLFTGDSNAGNRCVFYPNYKLICTVYYKDGSLAAVAFMGEHPQDVSERSTNKANDKVRKLRKQ